MIEWRDIEGHKLFSSRIRFQIRLDDFRETYTTGQAKADDILGFYNYATSLLLDRLSKEIKFTNGTLTWRPLVAYKNLIRAIENLGIASSYVVRYYAESKLTAEEVIRFLQVQVLSSEYINQASNFSPKVKRRIRTVESLPFYQNVRRG